jgi:hypothetical protein
MSCVCDSTALITLCLQAPGADICARTLLKRGANAKARDSLGRPALVIAINASTTRAHSAGLYARLLCDLLNHGAAEDALVLPYLAQRVTPRAVFPSVSIIKMLLRVRRPSVVCAFAAAPLSRLWACGFGPCSFLSKQVPCITSTRPILRSACTSSLDLSACVR